MRENSIMTIAVLSLLIGALGLGFGAFMWIQYQSGALKGSTGDDGDDGDDGISGTKGDDGLPGLSGNITIALLNPDSGESISGNITIDAFVVGSEQYTISILRNGTEIGTSIPKLWETEAIDDGWWNITIIATDIATNNISRDEVIVYVQNAHLGIEYFCSSENEITEALTSIGNGDGIITITKDIILSQNISIDGGGSYIIQSSGMGMTIDCNGDRTAIHVKNATSCTIQNLKIDGSDIATTALRIIYIEEINDNPVYIKNLEILGALIGINKYGIGIHIRSDKVWVSDCLITNVFFGIHLYNSKNNTIRNNIINSLQLRGIYLEWYSEYNIISGNLISTCLYEGIFLERSDYNVILGNIVSDVDHETGYSGYGGIVIYDNANNNTLNGNAVFSCNNPQTGYNNYGIYIRGSDCDYNTVIGNTALNNDINFATMSGTTFGDATNNNFGP